jgi:hypothetical protein
MINWILNKFKITPKKLTEQQIIKNYIDASYDFGIAVALIPVGGQCLGFHKLFNNFEKAEKDYFEAGFCPFPLEVLTQADFCDKEEWITLKFGMTIEEYLKLDNARFKPCLHSKIYKEHYLDKIGEIEKETGSFVFPTSFDKMEKYENIK